MGIALLPLVAVVAEPETANVVQAEEHYGHSHGHGKYGSSYQRPSYQRPSYQRSSYKQPSYKQPSYKQPSYQRPSYQRPSYKRHHSYGHRGYHHHGHHHHKHHHKQFPLWYKTKTVGDAMDKAIAQLEFEYSGLPDAADPPTNFGPSLLHAKNIIHYVDKVILQNTIEEEGDNTDDGNNEEEGDKTAVKIDS